MNMIKDIEKEIKKELQNKWFVGSFVAVLLITAIVGFWYYTGSDTREGNKLTDAMSKIENSIALKIETEKPDAPLEYKNSLKNTMLESNSDYQNMKNQYSEIVHGSANPLFLVALAIFIVAIAALAAMLLTLLLRYLYTVLKFDTKEDALAFYIATFKNILFSLIIIYAVLSYFYKG